MSSVPSNAGTGSPRASGSSAAPRRTDVGAQLRDHLRKTATFIKILDILVRVFAWLACVVGIWLVACLIEHWLMPLPGLARWVFWLALVGVTGWIFIRQIFPLLLGRINPDYAAMRIEQLEPEFKNGLISWHQLQSMPNSGVPRGVMAALTYRASRFLGGQDPSSTVDTSLLIKLLSGVLLMVAGMAIYSFVAPKSTFETGQRIVMPWLDIEAPTRVRIDGISPGSTTVSFGQPLGIEAHVTGLRDQEPVRVIFSTLDGQFVDQAIELVADARSLQYGGQLRTAAEGIEHALRYRLEAGDAESDWYEVDLAPLPSVVLETVELEFPEYTKLPKQIVGSRDVEAVEGTQATVHARSNQPLVRGRLELDPEVDHRGELSRASAVIPMQIDDRKLSASWLLRLNESQENPTTVGYRVRGFNARGDSNPDPIVQHVRVLADLAPEIRITGPESRVLRVRPNSRMQLEVRAIDPDFGLNFIELTVVRNGHVVGKRPLLQEEGVRGNQVKRQSLDIGRLKVQPGDTVEIRAVARDNRHDPVTKKLSPNETFAEPLILEIVGPEEPADENALEPPKDDPENQPGQESDENSPQNPDGDQQPSGAGNKGDGTESSDDNQSGSGGSSGGDAESGSEPGDEEQGSSGAGGDSSESSPSGNSKNESGGGSSSSGDDQSDEKNGAGGENNAGNKGDGNSNPSRDGGSKSDTQSQRDGEAVKKIQKFMESESDSQPSGNKEQPRPGDQQPSGEKQTGDSEKQTGNGEQQAGDGEKQTGDGEKQTGDGEKQTGDGEQQTGDGEKQTGDGEKQPGDGEKQPGDGEKQTGDGEKQTGDGEKQTGDGEKQTSDGEQQSGDGEQQTGDGEQQTSDGEQQAGNGEQQAGNGEQQAGNGEKQAGNGEKQPGDGEKQSGGGDTQPGGGEKQSGGGEKQSGGGEKQSGGGEKQSGSGDKQSGGGDEQAGGGDEQAGGGDEQAGGGDEQAGGGDEQAGGGDEQAGGGEKQSGGGEKQPGGGEKQPGGKQPEAGASESDPGKGGEKAGEGSPAGDKSGSPSGTSNSQSGAKEGDAGTGTPTSGDGASDADQANAEYAEKTTKMVLDYLDRQRDQPDPDLLKEVDWTQKDLEQFLDRWNRARDLAANGDGEDKERWNEMLQDLNLSGKRNGSLGPTDRNDNFRKMSAAGARSRPPERLRRQWDAFQKAISGN